MPSIRETRESLLSTFARPVGTRVIALGTSITAQNVASAPWMSGSTTSRGYLAWANVRLGHRLDVRNAGVSGNTFAQMLARIQADVLDHASDWVIVEGGPNDKDRTYADIVADLTAIYAAILGAGRRVVACTMTPTTAITTAGQKETFAKVNRWISNYARATPGVVLCDWAAVLSNATTGDPLTNVTSDGTHPSPYGARLMGEALADALSPFTPATTGLWLPTSNADTYNLVTNGMGVGTSGTLNAGDGSGETRTSWTIYNNGGTTAYTASKVARTDILGAEWSQIEATSGNDDMLKLQSANITTGWSVGDTIIATVEYEADADLATIVDHGMVVNCPGATGSAADLQRGSGEIALTANPGPSGVLRVQFAVPASTTSLQVQLQFRASLGTVRWGRVGIYNRTTLGV